MKHHFLRNWGFRASGVQQGQLGGWCLNLRPSTFTTIPSLTDPEEDFSKHKWIIFWSSIMYENCCSSIILYFHGILLMIYWKCVCVCSSCKAIAAMILRQLTYKLIIKVPDQNSANRIRTVWSENCITSYSSVRRAYVCYTIVMLKIVRYCLSFYRVDYSRLIYFNEASIVWSVQLDQFTKPQMFHQNNYFFLSTDRFRF